MVYAEARRYRDTPLIRKHLRLQPYSRPVPRALRWSWGRGGGGVLESEVPLTGGEGSFEGDGGLDGGC